MHGLLIAYNTLLSLLVLIGAPLLVPLILTTPKWRGIVRQRAAHWTYAWERRQNSRDLRTIWIHALSVGEVAAARPLAEALRDAGRFDRIVVSCSTFTGFNAAARLLAGYELCYFPFDWMGAVRRMADKIAPCAVIIVETDLWPNFLYEMRRRRVPVYLANVRLSDRTFAAWRRFRPAAAALYGTLNKIAVQSERDRRRFLQLGIADGRLGIAGNLKFDAADQAPDPHALGRWRDRLRIAADARVLVAGSTHPGEEAVVLEAVMRALRGGVRCRLLVAPRDPSRAGEIVLLAARRGFSAQLLGAEMEPAPADVVVIDRFGVLKTLYGLADVAFVGGSLVRSGGHNPLEPAAWGKAVLFGPDMRDFASIAQWLLESGGAIPVADAASFSAALIRLLADREAVASMGRRAKAVFEAHEGAARRTLAFFGLGTAVEKGNRGCR